VEKGAEAMQLRVCVVSLAALPLSVRGQLSARARGEARTILANLFRSRTVSMSAVLESSASWSLSTLAESGFVHNLFELNVPDCLIFRSADFFESEGSSIAWNPPSSLLSSWRSVSFTRSVCFNLDKVVPVSMIQFTENAIKNK
jgi:hypothetical protein